MEGYFELTPNIKYRVLAITSRLTGSKGSEAIIVRSEDKYPHIASVPFSELEIVDDTPEDDWVGGIFTHGQVAEPMTIVGYPALVNDAAMYVRIHDLNEEDGDLSRFLDQYDKYGKNEIDENFDASREARFHRAEEAIEEYFKHGPSSNGGDRTYMQEYATEYLDNLRIVDSYLCKEIAESSSNRQRTLLAIKMQRCSSLAEALERVDGIQVAQDLAAIARNSMNPLDQSVLLEKILKGEITLL